MAITFQPQTGVLLMQCTCPTDGTVLRCILSPSTPCALQGRPPFPWSCHKGQHLASSLLTAQEHRLHKVLVPGSLGSLPAGYTALARRAPSGPRRLGDRRRLALISARPGLPQIHWVFDEPVRARGGRQGRRGAGGRARVRTDRAPGRRCPALPRPWWPGAGRGLEPREQEQRPYRPLFRLHLLRLLLLPPATRAVTTGSDWPGCPAKEKRQGANRGEELPGKE